MFFILAAFGCAGARPRPAPPALAARAGERRSTRPAGPRRPPAGSPCRGGGWPPACCSAAPAGSSGARCSSCRSSSLLVVCVGGRRPPHRPACATRRATRSSTSSAGWSLAFVADPRASTWPPGPAGSLTDDGYYRHCLRETNGQTSRRSSARCSTCRTTTSEAYDFHSAPRPTQHTYQSWPWQWLLLGRPVAFYWTGNGPCGATSCAAEILLLGTPLLWWSFLPGAGRPGLVRHRPPRLAGRARSCSMRRRRPAAVVLLRVSTAARCSPSTPLPALPFLILAVVYVLGAIMTPPGVTWRGRRSCPTTPLTAG